ncbi:MAG: hypothetical protein ACQERT_10865 [Thermodesulfobacteriota bacterium]
MAKLVRFWALGCMPMVCSMAVSSTLAQQNPPAQEKRTLEQMQEEQSSENVTATIRWAEKNTIGIQFNQLIRFSADVLESLFFPPGRPVHEA